MIRPASSLQAATMAWRASNVMRPWWLPIPSAWVVRSPYGTSSASHCRNSSSGMVSMSVDPQRLRRHMVHKAFLLLSGRRTAVYDGILRLSCATWCLRWERGLHCRRVRRAPQDLLTKPVNSRWSGRNRRRRAASMADTRLSIRLDLTSGDRIGPGKIPLLQAIQSTGSISAAARRLGMSYRRGWAVGVDRDQYLPPTAVPAWQGRRRAAGGG